MLGICNDIVFFTTRKTLEFNGKNVKFEGDCMSQLMTTQPPMSVTSTNGMEQIKITLKKTLNLTVNRD